MDGNALLHRAWHALPPLTTKDGLVVNAAYGFAMVLEKMLETRKPDYMAVAWDLPGKTFRHEKYEDYKGTRETKEQELYDQIPMIQEILEAFDIPSYEAEGFEADDVIGTLAKKMDKKSEVEVQIVTGDLDALQLLTDGTKVLFFQKGISETKLYDIKAVKERYGLTPEELIDYKALKGDASDNIPGVKGIGDKIATDLIQKFGSLEKLYKEAEKAGKAKEAEKAAEKLGIKTRVLELLLDQKQQAFESQELVTIVTDVPVKFKLSDVRIGKQDEERIVELYKDYDFRSLLRKRGLAEKIEKAGKARKAKKDLAKISNDLEILKGAKELAFFVGENQQADLFGSGLAILAMSDGKKTVVVSNPSDKQLKQALEIIDSAKQVVVHDLKSMMHILSTWHVARGGSFLNDVRPATSDLRFHDLMIGAYLLNSGARNYDIETIVRDSLSEKLPEFPEQFGSEKEAKAVGANVAVFLKLAKAQIKELEEEGMDKLFLEVEMPLVPVLFQMEQTGIKLDLKFLEKFSKDLNDRIKKLTTSIHKQAGTEFNINSPAQLADVLFEKLELPTKGIKRTKSSYSTAAPELEKLKGEHKIIPLIEEYRELSKLASTYVDALPKLIGDDGRIHTSYNQTVTATGRLSSSDPNLQNIPIRTELGRQMRQAFVADKGKVLIAADYSQIELRLVAEITGDKAFQKAFSEGADIHARTAAEVFELDEAKVTKEQRRAAKAINFGIVYGMGPRALAAQTDMSFSEAQDFIERYFELHVNVRDYLDSVKEKAHEEEFVESMFGRRRYLPEINSGVQMLVAAAERMAINMPIQGSSSDLMKMAMLKVSEWTDQEEGIDILLQVHDELVFEADKDKAEEFGKRIKQLMEKVVKIKVPLVVDIEIGKNWGEMK